jgi:hypothetical protein
MITNTWPHWTVELELSQLASRVFWTFGDISVLVHVKGCPRVGGGEFLQTLLETTWAKQCQNALYSLQSDASENEAIKQLSCKYITQRPSGKEQSVPLSSSCTSLHRILIINSETIQSKWLQFLKVKMKLVKFEGDSVAAWNRLTGLLEYPEECYQRPSNFTNLIFTYRYCNHFDWIVSEFIIRIRWRDIHEDDRGTDYSFPDTSHTNKISRDRPQISRSNYYD